VAKLASGWLWPFRPSRARADGEKLLAAVTQISRQPVFFGPERVPDTLEGRLEMMTLHASLVLTRLGGDPNMAQLGQAFVDLLFRHFDAGLREAAVGDLTVPKRMRKLASSFYGRHEAYSAALRAEDRAALIAALARNVFGAEPEAAPFAARLAEYAQGTVRKQAAAAPEALFRLDGWLPAPV